MEAAACDALFLHRPWDSGWSGPLVASHEPFDATLGLGTAGQFVRAALGLDGAPVVTLGEAGETGVVGDTALPVGEQQLRALFGDVESFAPGRRLPAAGAHRVALARALRPGLVEDAARAGAELYVTGQWRPSAQEALTRSGVAVAIVGHRRAELWALRTLAGLLEQRFAGLECRLVEPNMHGGPLFGT